MKNFLLPFFCCLALGCSIQKSQAQIVPPYIQHFDSTNCTGWTHYAISGTDDWQRGVPIGPYLNTASSSPNVWGTNLSGATTDNSIMALQTPDFDLSDTTKEYMLTFWHEYQTYTYHGGNIEYSLNGGTTWTLLNGTAGQKVNWYTNTSCSGLGGQPAWSNNYYSTYKYSGHTLIAFKGQHQVRFRFKYGGTSNPQDGWMIDDFAITENIPNVVATQGVTYNASRNFINFDVASALVYNSLVPPAFSNTTNYYFSRDNVFDAGDSLLGTKTQTINASVSSWLKTFTMVPNLHAGDYYIFYTHDFLNNLAEGNETDNTNYCILHIDSTFNAVGYKEDHEDTTNIWKTNAASVRWKRGASDIHQAEGVRGKRSLYTVNLYFSAPGATSEYMESPWLDFSSANGNVMCFWYKMKRNSGANTRIEISKTNTLTSYLAAGTRTVPLTRMNGWDCHCEDLTYLNGQNNAKIRFNYSDAETYGLCNQNITIDDFYFGQRKPDLSIENKNGMFTQQGVVTDTLHYMLFNSGLIAAPASVTEFYWSTDSIADAGDLLIASVNEAAMTDTSYRYESVTFTKPTTAPGTYYILYKTDAANALNEMWEENNTGFFKITQLPVTAVPYTNDFETQTDSWFHEASIGPDIWQWGPPPAAPLTPPFSGTKAFYTSVNATSPDMTRSHLYTPVFDLSGVVHPVMEFDMSATNDGNCDCTRGQMNMSYSLDNGATWKVLDTTAGQSYNRWYYGMDYSDYGGTDHVYYLANYTDLLYAPNERAFAGNRQYNARDLNENTKYVIDLGFLAGNKNVRFRFNLAKSLDFTTPQVAESGTVQMDNFIIREKFSDLRTIYKKSLMLSSGRNNVNFDMHLRNDGNYKTAPASVKFYVSADTVLDASDFYLGSDTIKAIRPYMNYYLNEKFNGPAGLGSYSYLLYKIDPANQNAESNELNNTGYWKLALDTIISFPYLMDFNDTVLNGWNQYTIDIYGAHVKDEWRFRNFLAPGEYAYSTLLQSGQMFTDRINNVIGDNQVPYWYLETPCFNFSASTNIKMTFDMMVIGTGGINPSGGNMDYSTDGGNTWSLLQESMAIGGAYHWYNFLSVGTLGNQPGWTTLVKPGTLLDSVYFDLDFLAGQPKVSFRYRFRSKASPSGLGTPYGMRIDNFRITADPGMPTSVNDPQNPGMQMYFHEDELSVIVPEKLADPATSLAIYNTTGQKIYSSKVNLAEGTNRFMLSLDVAPGVYLVQLVNSSETRTLRFVAK